MSDWTNEFRNETKKQDYTNTATVVSELISAINKYKEFELQKAGGDMDRASEKLIAAGTQAYQAMEHAYKNRIYWHYEYEFRAGKIDSWVRDTKILFDPVGHYDTHSDLKNKFCEFEKEPKANLDLILNGADLSGNKPKHDARVPDHVALKAQLVEMVKFFRAYMDPDAHYPSLSASFAGEQYAWQEFKEKVGGFGSEYQYMLVAPSYLDDQYDLAALFHVNWDLILDFNPDTDTNGIMEAFIQERNISPNSRTLSYEKKWESFQLTAYPQWIRANGMSSKAESVKTKFVNWRMAYGAQLAEILTRFRETYPKYLKIVVLPGVGKNYLEYMIPEILTTIYDDKTDSYYGIDIVLLGDSGIGLEEEYSNVSRCALRLTDFLTELRNSPVSDLGMDEIKTLPGIQDPNGLSRDLCAKLENFCQPIYLGIQETEPEGDVEEFYRAQRPISWRELGLGKDLRRGVYAESIYGKLQTVLNSRPKSFYNINYKPGYGGTTMLRRIAWDFHGRYPTVLLRRYDEEDIHCLRQLYEKTKLAFLVLVDSNVLTKTEADSVHKALKQEKISHVVLFMNRRKRTNEQKDESELFAIPELNDRGEVRDMVNLLLRYAAGDECKNRLRSFHNGQINAGEKSPFFFALTAFEEKFEGIPKYVHNYLKDLSADMKELLVFIALADYINKSLDVQFFARHLRISKVEDFLNEQLAFRSLVTFFDNGNQRFCKIKHASFATEILAQVTTGYSEEGPTEINFPELKNYILDFIEFSRPNSRIVNNNLTEFLREMLITRRADTDANKPKFSKLICEIGGYTAKINPQWDQTGQGYVGEIFKKLTDVYPDDPHFNAHRGRFVCYVNGEYDEAVTILDNAIDYQSGTQQTAGKSVRRKVDPLLLHMKGMVYVARITRWAIPKIIEDYNRTRDENIDEEKMRILQADFEKAQKIFSEVRKMRSHQLAGYISDIQMCIDIIDMKKKTEGGGDSALFWERHPADWYMQLADHANSLYDACYAEAAEGEDLTQFMDIKGAIRNIREGIEASIEWYREYLKVAPDSKRPYLRRHLARAYMQRNERENSQEDWQNIVDLMEQNMQEEPGRESNIRTWFNAVLHLRSENPDNMLRYALEQLNRWISNSSDNVSAHFYRYMLTFIQAEEGMSSAADRLKGYLRTLSHLTADIPGNTNIRYWLGESGRGIERLIPHRDFPQGTQEAIPMLHMLQGFVHDFKSDEHAHIEVHKNLVFFAPYATKGQITSRSVDTRVTFGMGFSYEGPRAYNDSVRPYTGQERNRVERKKLEPGDWVVCSVTGNNQYYVYVEIIGYPSEEASIYVDNLREPYSADNRPEVETTLYAKVMRQKEIDSRNGRKMIWELTMLDDEEKPNKIQRSNNRQAWQYTPRQEEETEPVDEELLQKYAPKEESDNSLQDNPALKALLEKMQKGS